MRNDSRDHATVRFPPPLVFAGALVAGYLLHGYVHALPLALAPWLRTSVTALAAVLSVTFMVGAVGLFKRTGQDPKPWKTTPQLITTGIYRFTRNPMYVSMALLQLAIGAGLANGWILVLVPVSLTLVHLSAVRHEEVYLESKFGEEYLGYKQSVRRWI